MFEVTSGVKNEAIKTILYGPEGIGKTSLAAQWPDPLFIDTEGSTKHYDVKRLKDGETPSSWQEFISMIRWVRESKPCSTLVIDTADWAARIAGTAVIQEHNKKGIEDFGYGNGYVYQLEKYGDMLDELTLVQESGINVVITAHAEIKKFEDPGEMGAYDRWELKLLKRGNANIAALTKEWADMVLFLNYKVISVKANEMGNKFKGQGGQRVMYTEHRPAWDAKNRFNLPLEIPLDYAGIAHVIPDLVGSQPVQQPVQQQPAPTQAVEQQPEPVAVTPEPTNEPTAQPEPQATDPFEANPLSPEQVQQAEAIFNDSAKGLKPSYLPDALWDLMQANNITEDEVRAVMGVRGHYPINTPFETIAETQPAYFTGGLAANWDGVVSELTNIRSDKQAIVDLYQKVGDETPEQTVDNLTIQWS